MNIPRGQFSFCNAAARKKAALQQALLTRAEPGHPARKRRRPLQTRSRYLATSPAHCGLPGGLPRPQCGPYAACGGTRPKDRLPRVESAPRSWNARSCKKPPGSMTAAREPSRWEALSIRRAGWDNLSCCKPENAARHLKDQPHKTRRVLRRPRPTHRTFRPDRALEPRKRNRPANDDSRRCRRLSQKEKSAPPCGGNQASFIRVMSSLSRWA